MRLKTIDKIPAFAGMTYPAKCYEQDATAQQRYTVKVLRSRIRCGTGCTVMPSFHLPAIKNSNN